MNVRINEIIIPNRIRQDYGDISLLAESIRTHGLINPITLMQAENGYVLLAGARRLEAAILNGCEQIQANVLSPLDAEEQLHMEIEENEKRKDFTIMEKLQYAEKLREVEAAKAYLRQCRSGSRGAPPAYKGRTRDILAQRVGFRSGRQLDRAFFVANQRPDLMEQVNAGKKSISGAYDEAKGVTRNAKTDDSTFKGSYAFVLNEVVYAVDMFKKLVEQAAEHYKQIEQTDARSEAIFRILDNAAKVVQDAFGESITT